MGAWTVLLIVWFLRPIRVPGPSRCTISIYIKLVGISTYLKAFEQLGQGALRVVCKLRDHYVSL